MGRRERDALVETWIDRRYLATAALKMSEQGAPPVSMSDIVRACVETVVNSGVNHGIVKEIQTTAEANGFLRRFKANLNRGDRGKRNLMRNLQMDVMEAEAGGGETETDQKVRLALAEFEKNEKRKLEELEELENPTFEEEDKASFEDV